MEVVCAVLYLDSRTLQVLLVKLEMTSCKISLRYLSTYNPSAQAHMYKHMTQPLIRYCGSTYIYIYNYT